MLQAVLSTFLVVGPVVGYVAEWHNIRRTNTADGFSLRVSYILLLCNTLRVCYWFGAAFALPLLLQSLLMIAVQALLVCTALSRRAPGPHALPAPAVVGTFLLAAHPSQAQPAALHAAAGGVWTAWHRGGAASHPAVSGFLRWWLTGTVLAGAVLLPLVRAVPAAASAVGFVALGVEATLLVPQLQLNNARRCVDVAPLLLLTWIGGDVAKAAYFVVLEQPWPFLGCAAVQLALDAVLVLQLAWFGNGPARDGAAGLAGGKPSTPANAAPSSRIVLVAGDQ